MILTLGIVNGHRRHAANGIVDSLSIFAHQYVALIVHRLGACAGDSQI